MKLYVEGVGLRGPGLVNWPAGRDVLAGRTPYVPADVVLVASELLPVAERRRTTDAVKLALIVGSEAMTHAQASLRAGNQQKLSKLLICAAPD